MKQLTFHPACEIFPLMSGVEFESLMDDIRVNGQREPILITEDDQIVDGRNRYLACCKLGFIPVTAKWDGKKDIPSIVLSANLHRRHLTKSQRAALGFEISKLFEAEARARRLSGLKQNEHLTRGIWAWRGETRDLAARACYVNRRYISDAKRIAAADPALFSRVKAGTITITAASRAIRHDRRFRSLSRSRLGVEITIRCGHDNRTLHFEGDFPDAVQRIKAAIGGES